jgi:hypothetical protein
MPIAQRSRLKMPFKHYVSLLSRKGREHLPISRLFYMENFEKKKLPGLVRLIKEPEDVVEPETDVDPDGVEKGLHHHSQDHQGPGERGHACFFCLLSKLLLKCLREQTSIFLTLWGRRNALQETELIKNLSKIQVNCQ